VRIVIVIGIDAATWNIINPNLDDLPNFKRLKNTGKSGVLEIDMKPLSAAVWCSMFCGRSPEEHGNLEYVINDKLQTRHDIKVEFIWDILKREGFDVKALNIPFIVPPYNFNCDFKPVGFGLPVNEMEWEEELERVTEKAKEIIKSNPDFFAVVYTSLDRIQHFHWGEPIILEWYKKMDEKLGELLNLIRENDKLIVISDHGFCSREEAKVQTLPEMGEGREIKGDHSDEGIVITKNVNYEIKRPQDVFFAIKKEMGVS
jgi:predicted AlkP superfamily phosphohydrolase/phosphomutase